MDIRNSQPVFLVKLLRTHLLETNQEPTDDQQNYMRICESGQLYDHLLEKAASTIPDYLVKKRRLQEKKRIWKERFLVHLCATVRPKNSAEYRDAYRRFLRQNPVNAIEVQDAPVNRQDFKLALFADVFYGKAEVNTPLTKLFDEEFPNVFKFIRDHKRQHGYESLSREMQRAEADFMIDTVCLRLLKHHSDIPILTVHDSILTTPGHLPTVRRIIEEEFERIGMKPTMKEV